MSIEDPQTVISSGPVHVVLVPINGKTYLVVAETDWDEGGLNVRTRAIGEAMSEDAQEAVQDANGAVEAVYEAVQTAEQVEMDRLEREQWRRDAIESWQHCDDYGGVDGFGSEAPTVPPPEDDIPF